MRFLGLTRVRGFDRVGHGGKSDGLQAVLGASYADLEVQPVVLSDDLVERAIQVVPYFEVQHAVAHADVGELLLAELLLSPFDVDEQVGENRIPYRNLGLRDPGLELEDRRHLLELMLFDLECAGKLRVDLRLWVLRDHANMSLYPTQIAFAAQQQGQLWQFVDLFYNFQRPEAASSSFIARLLDAMPELDADRVFADANRAAVVEQINRVDYEAEQLGVTGTPSFLISRRNGIPRPLGNEEELLDKSELFSAIETELKKTPR